MKIGVSPLERAFQLARSGQVAAITELKDALRAEGYGIDEIDGPVIHQQLWDLIKAGRAEAVTPAVSDEVAIPETPASKDDPYDGSPM